MTAARRGGNLSLIRRSSRQMFARFISPICAPPTVPGVPVSLCESRSLKMSAGRYRRLSPHSGHPAMIQVSGRVLTGAGTISLQPLHQTA